MSGLTSSLSISNIFFQFNWILILKVVEFRRRINHNLKRNYLKLFLYLFLFVCLVGLSLPDYHSSITSHKGESWRLVRIMCYVFPRMNTQQISGQCWGSEWYSKWYFCSDFDPNPGEDKRPNICTFLENNLGFGDLWWLLGLVQLSPLLPLLVLYR